MAAIAVQESKVYDQQNPSADYKPNQHLGWLVLRLNLFLSGCFGRSEYFWTGKGEALFAS